VRERVRKRLGDLRANPRRNRPQGAMADADGPRDRRFHLLLEDDREQRDAD
jgi:hypothetical protein